MGCFHDCHPAYPDLSPPRLDPLWSNPDLDTVVTARMLDHGWVSAVSPPVVRLPVCDAVGDDCVRVALSPEATRLIQAMPLLSPN